MENNYLIPANAKKSQYFLGFFTGLDLIIVGVGVVLTFGLLLFIKNITLGLLIVKLLPGVLGAFLVMPVPHYHNVLQLLINVFNFYTNRRIYYWRGWNVNEEFGTKK